MTTTTARATVVVRDRVGTQRCAEAAAAALVAAALRAGGTPTVECNDDPTRWRFHHDGTTVGVEALNPSLFTETSEPPTWATRLAATAARLL